MINLSKLFTPTSKSAYLLNLSDNLFKWCLLVVVFIFQPWNIVFTAATQPMSVPPPKVVVPEPVPPVLIVPDIAKKHEALARAYLIEVTCYDPANELWLVKKPSEQTLKKHVDPKDIEDDYTSGWVFSHDKDVQFLTLSNNTMMLDPEKEGGTFEMYAHPDVTGLDCHTHKIKGHYTPS